ncbi:hypothetical protein MMC13_000085 [Lambiella insularis]|nr:hypothetical protein [Lambiella insularis]
MEDSPKRIRSLLNKQYIVDSIHAKLVWEHPYYPQYYVPRSDVKTSLTEVETLPDGAQRCKVLVDCHEVNNILVFPDGRLKDLVRFDFKSMDAWFEEDQQIFVHAMDPHKRIDIRRSSRHIRVEIDGVTVAESSNAMHLFETMLPTRYYLPATCVDPKRLIPSNTVTSCPYKGDASYYNLMVNGKEHKDVIWYYKFPTPESLSIAGLFCFYNEKIDLWIDGIKQ